MTESVRQLGKLRKHSLLINAVCNRWEMPQPQGTVVEESALATWRVARVTTAWLSAWPSSRFHPAPSRFAHFALAFSAWRHAAACLSDAARLRWLSQQMGRLARDAADIRALTASPQINEMLVRHLPALNTLALTLREMTGSEATVESGAVDAHVRLAIPVQQDHWPHFSV